MSFWRRLLAALADSTPAFQRRGKHRTREQIANAKHRRRDRLTRENETWTRQG